MSRFNTAALIACASLMTLSAAAPANAATVSKNQRGTAAANCQGALPSFEGAIRKRPLSVQNEGSTTAFVTCAFSVSASAVTRATIFVNAIGGAEVTVTCTAVNGYNTGSPAYSTKSVVAAASGGQGNIVFVASDFGGTSTFPRGSWMSISCSLPPGAGINDTELVVSDEIGA